MLCILEPFDLFHYSLSASVSTPRGVAIVTEILASLARALLFEDALQALVPRALSLLLTLSILRAYSSGSNRL